MCSLTGGDLTRRRFLQIGSATVTSASIVKSGQVRGSAANSAIRIGLLGCGHRGTTDAESMLQHPDGRIVALGDMFEDRLSEAKSHFDELGSSRGHSKIDGKLLFKGRDAYQQMAVSTELDAIIIASPDFLHPMHLEATIAAGKHVYSEKPTGVDVAGAKRYLAIGSSLGDRQSLAVGFQIRKATPFVKLVDQIHRGALGTIVCGQGYYYTSGLKLPEWPNASPAERKLRRWYFYRELTGGILVDQGIHVLDIFNWALRSRPLKASGGGGRKVRQDEGNCWDHYNLTYFYPNDVHVTFSSTQFDSGWSDVCQRLFGTDGVSESHYTGPMQIHGKSAWKLGADDAANLADANGEKAKSFVQSIVDGKYLNEAEQGAQTTLTAILGRMAAARGGDPVTWDEMMASNEEMDPKLDWDQI